MMRMKLHLLAVETSSNICHITVLSSVDGTVSSYSESNDEPGRHAEHILPMVDRLLVKAGISRRDLGAIAFGQGPGGFTGLRVACGVAQGIAFGLGLPAIPVASLLAVAVRAHHEVDSDRRHKNACYLVVQDARMDEAYLAAYQPPLEAGQAWRTLQSPILIDIRQIQGWFERRAADWGLTQAGPGYIVGDALDAFPQLADIDRDRLQAVGSWRADASTVAHIALAAWKRGETVSPENAAPLYVRDKVAFTTSERLHGAGGNPRAPAHDAIIQPMSDKHLDAVAAIEARVQSFPWTRRNFADGLAAGYSAWVACQHEKVIGFYMAMLAPDVAHLLVIAVDPDYQGKGIGKALLDHCQAQAQSRGLDTMVLEVRFSNQAAIGFYKHEGFESFAVRNEYYPAPDGKREDACVMKKSWPVRKVST